MRAVLRRALSVIQPSATEVRTEQRHARSLAGQLQRAVPRGVRAVVAGSIAKGTFLKHGRDIDIFLLWPAPISKKQMESLTLRAVRRAFPACRYEVKYAEHPYVRMFFPPRRLDIVPAYAIRSASERATAVDRSVLHARFIRRRLRPMQIPEVLLLKQFLKSAELYGAEIAVQGISGYACELLILQYGRFASFLRAALKWKSPVFLDPNRFYRTPAERQPVLRKFNTPLVIIDPVDMHRNVTAAVSPDSFRRLVLHCKKFLQLPAARFFSAPPSFDEKRKRMQARAGHVYTICLYHTPAVDDILWGQLRKLEHQLRSRLEHHEFRVRESIMDLDSRRVTLAICVAQNILPRFHWVAGPRISMKHHVQAFRKAHRGARFRIKNRRIYARVRRPFTALAAALSQFFKESELPSHFRKNGMRIRHL